MRGVLFLRMRIRFSLHFFFIVEAPLFFFFRSGDGGGGMTWRDLLVHAHAIFPPLSSAVEAPLLGSGGGGGGMTWRDLLVHAHPIFPPLFCSGGGVEWRGFVRMRMKFEWRAILWLVVWLFYDVIDHVIYEVYINFWKVCHFKISPSELFTPPPPWTWNLHLHFGLHTSTSIWTWFLHLHFG